MITENKTLDRELAPLKAIKMLILTPTSPSWHLKAPALRTNTAESSFGWLSAADSWP